MAKRLSDADRQRYVLYFRGHRPPDIDRRIWVPILFDPAAAKALVLHFCGNNELERFHNVITLDNGMTLTCEQLDEVMAADETSVTLNPEYARTALRFKLGTWDEVHGQPDEQVIDKPDGTKQVVKAPKPEKPKRAKKPDHYVTIGELCKEWGIKPLHARTCLRASDLVKPDFGWAFDPKDIPKVKKICEVK